MNAKLRRRLPKGCSGSTGDGLSRWAMLEFKRILVPLDGSPLAEKALPLAISLAQKYKSQIILLQVLKFFVLPRCPHQEILPGETIEAYRPSYQEANNYLQAWQRPLCKQGLDICIRLQDTSPDQSVAAVIVSQEVDLIVMATHGRGGLVRWLFGSVADQVVRGSHCPVLLVRENEGDETKGRGKRVTDEAYLLQNGDYTQFCGTLAPGFEGAALT